MDAKLIGIVITSVFAVVGAVGELRPENERKRWRKAGVAGALFGMFVSLWQLNVDNIQAANDSQQALDRFNETIGHLTAIDANVHQTLARAETLQQTTSELNNSMVQALVEQQRLANGMFAQVAEQRRLNALERDVLGIGLATNRATERMLAPVRTMRFSMGIRYDVQQLRMQEFTASVRRAVQALNEDERRAVDLITSSGKLLVTDSAYAWLLRTGRLPKSSVADLFFPPDVELSIRSARESYCAVGLDYRAIADSTVDLTYIILDPAAEPIGPERVYQVIETKPIRGRFMEANRAWAAMHGVYSRVPTQPIRSISDLEGQYVHIELPALGFKPGTVASEVCKLVLHYGPPYYAEEFSPLQMPRTDYDGYNLQYDHRVTPADLRAREQRANRDDCINGQPFRFSRPDYLARSQEERTANGLASRAQ